MNTNKDCIDLNDLKKSIKYDPDTGVFIWTEYRGRNAKVGSIAGTVNGDGRIGIVYKQNKYLAHRLAWFYMTGSWPINEIDHKDGNVANNKFSNLREATREVNAQNIRIARANNKSSGLLGVYLHKKGRWMASIGINKRLKYLGLFDSKEEAQVAYLNAKRKFHEGCLI